MTASRPHRRTGVPVPGSTTGIRRCRPGAALPGRLCHRPRTSWPTADGKRTSCTAARRPSWRAPGGSGRTVGTAPAAGAGSSSGRDGRRRSGAAGRPSGRTPGTLPRRSRIPGAGQQPGKRDHRLRRVRGPGRERTGEGGQVPVELPQRPAPGSRLGHQETGAARIQAGNRARDRGRRALQHRCRA